MIEPILEGLYRIPVPLPGNPLRELNAYLIRGRERSLLVDTGFRQEPCRRALFGALGELGLGPGDVDVLLTHLHSDHAGLAPEAAGGAGTIYVSAVDRPSLESPAARAAFWDEMHARFRAEGFPPDALGRMEQTNPARSMAPPEGGRYASLEDGDVLETGGLRLKCLLMPGHTPGQMCFWLEEQGVMLLGDHVLFDITPNITAWPELPDALGSYLESLAKIREYPVAIPLPGHRGPGAFRARVDALLEHHRRRLDEALSAVRARPGSGACALAGHMTWKIRARSWADFPEVQKWFAVGECMSHLDHLIALGAVEKRMEGGFAAYYPV
ncbi:hypothetical protein CE91St41_39960 [Oscillospiraceae bacterium]|nr:hypothetical protein CE91St40_39930 [Oscillospiraceae bacterium]BDF77107.1 hypothetical protein CE91St41_39960 [Oscillospiraceae bacterium]